MYLRDRPCDETAVVIGIGEKSFSVLIEKYGFESRLFVEEMNGVISSYDGATKTMTLTNKKTDKTMQTFDKIDICVLSRVIVNLSAKSKPPIDLSVQLVRLASSEATDAELMFKESFII